nr:hypothetical protein [Tanacetum cinerariifolium]
PSNAEIDTLGTKRSKNVFDTEQAELDVLKAVKNNINDLSSKSEDKSLETEIDEALKTAKTEQAELEVLKAVKNNINDLSSKSENKSLEMEISRLKELLYKEKKRADIETKKAETKRKGTVCVLV